MVSYSLNRSRIYFVLIVLTTTCLVGCTYVRRTEYRLGGDEESITSQGWIITPKIISRGTHEKWKIPVQAPHQFAISFRAALGRPEKQDTPAEIIDIRIDSAHAQFCRVGLHMVWIFNQSSWVSYPAISPDTLVKVFSVVGENGELDWLSLPSEEETLEISLFTTVHTGQPTLRVRGESPVALDTVIWSDNSPDRVLEPITLRVKSLDIIMAVPGFLADR